MVAVVGLPRKVDDVVVIVSSLIGTARMARDTGTLPIAHLVGPYVTTRTLKRRGKRNPTP